MKANCCCSGTFLLLRKRQPPVSPPSHLGLVMSLVEPAHQRQPISPAGSNGHPPRGLGGAARRGGPPYGTLRREASPAQRCKLHGAAVDEGLEGRAVGGQVLVLLLLLLPPGGVLSRTSHSGERRVGGGPRNTRTTCM
jgi:hypothetical protein